ncbi:MAG: winged helix-turn-helix transcriptional regulator [Firmicutes bacterium]|nr:winged helix-turn-helix transcriptional regulator [Bacillota bacterium]
MSAKKADKSVITEEDLYDLADLFKAFSDTTRVKLLYALMEGELCVADLTEKTGATQSAVSHQLRSLKQMDLVRGRKDGKQVIYSLADDHVRTILQMGMDHVKE